ncbi:calmodulin-A-like [Mytilus californianus]|uniref:calmodulin-A-like n=1 Tax=Mytilus californianus TaxID=6549 RepID=UPI0022456B09|nr:calmodulin-A-like [Mytilus californianus]
MFCYFIFFQVEDLTPEEVAEFRETFKFFDKDGDGTISVNEIRTVMRSIGQNPTEADVEAILTRYDGDGNGKLDFNEFLGMIVDKLNNPETELLNAFKLFDKDGNGFVNVDELKYIVTHLGDQLTDEEVQEMFDEADLNNDGQLNYEEFTVLMAS